MRRCLGDGCMARLNLAACRAFVFPFGSRQRSFSIIMDIKLVRLDNMYGSLLRRHYDST
jgi:hypothetical protein